MATARPVNASTTVDSRPADGRGARRQRNMTAVVDAFLDLVNEGVAEPGVADVAARSGVSHRSVFRYFADRDELARVAFERAQARVAPILLRPVDKSAPLDDRIEQLLACRTEAYRQLAPAARQLRNLALRQPALQGHLSRMRLQLRGVVQRLFAPELAAMDEERAADVLSALDVLTSFEAYELLRDDQKLSKARQARALSTAMAQLLLPPAPARATRRK